MRQFYDELAEDYHLVYIDWEGAIRRQTAIIDSLLKRYQIESTEYILDCTCGIGTQSLGLAQLGYKLKGTDISPISISRAKKEANIRNLNIAFEAVDVRELSKNVTGEFGAVISFDNSLPHLITHEDMALAAQQIFAKVKKGGIFMASTRDYDSVLVQKPSSTQPVSRMHEGKRTISFQVWDWETEDIYLVNHFTLEGAGESYQTRLRKTRYRAWSREAFATIFKQQGFIQTAWLMPEETGFYQPIFVGRKPNLSE